MHVMSVISPIRCLKLLQTGSSGSTKSDWFEGDKQKICPRVCFCFFLKNLHSLVVVVVQNIYELFPKR